ncbi:MAG: hypothetical protein JRI59_09335 [Deltaproteobacteria bacterium]|nr:hypothetical protein [Deltaproteobacteria bacterium]
MSWLDNLEFEIEMAIRTVILKHGRPIAVDHPKVKRLFQNLTAVRRLKEEVYEPRNRAELSA